MKSRYRPAGATKRSNKIPISLNDEEYQLLIDAANIDGLTPSGFMAEVALREAAHIMEKNSKKRKK